MKDPVPSGESALLQSVIDLVADPIFVKDRDHRWVLFNDAFLALLGHSRKRLFGKSDYEFFPKAQADVFWRQDELVFSTGRENSNEETLTDANGRVHVLVTRKRRWVSPEGGQYLVGVIRDITDFVDAVDDAKKSRERLHRAQRLETLGHLAGGVAHDFNNLLTAIGGSAGLLLESLPPGHPARVDAEEIRLAGARAAALTGRLLSFGRRPSGLARPTDLRAVVTGMKDMLRRLLPPDVELEIATPSRLAAVRVDPGLIEQILLNLVVNAGEAMPEGGTVTVEVLEAPKGGGGLRGACAVLSVRDQGPGMDEKTRRRAFEPFFSTKENGSGLGLSTVAETAIRSAGRMTVDSAPGRGSDFRVYWRTVAESADGPAAPAPAQPQPAGVRGRALVVDDDDAVRRFAARCLERAGYEVLSASDGAEALSVAGANEGLFDVLVLDVALPRLRGPELAARLRATQPAARVVYMSGRGREDCGLPSGERAEFLAKPFTAQDLTRGVSDARRGAGGPSRRARPRARARSRRTAS